MHFTVVFESHESYDLSYSVVFIPPPVWMKARRQIINLHPDWASYMKGDLKPLLELEKIEQRLASGKRNALIVIHRTGHGTADDLATLRSDLEEAGFAVQEIAFA